MTPREPTGKPGSEKGAVYTDRTYRNRETGQIITVETVDLRGSLTREKFPLDLRDNERHHAQEVFSRKPDEPVFTIPKLKK